ncbi:MULTISPECIES: phosphopantetheine-binding protein [unclassified Kitasatospora]|uniref:phosphopantetheine-binding protein n=1 Tax=unclassified Kitasatospora TaxID=2633591 RepID=UPI0037166FC8
MNTIDDFLTLVHAEIGLSLTPDSLALGFDELPGWDSLHLLTLLTALERETGQQVSMPKVLEAGSLRDIYELTARSGT